MSRRIRGSGSLSRSTRRDDPPILPEEEINDGEARASTSRTPTWVPPAWETHQLVFCPEHHISHRLTMGVAEDRLRHHGSGGGNLIGQLFKSVMRDPATQVLWESCGLSGFMTAMEGLRSSTRGGSLVVRGLLEYFWDTTNTFHFPWGEMTITPLDFTMITGLVFRTPPVMQDDTLLLTSPEVEELLGPIIGRVRLQQTSKTRRLSMRSISSLTLAEGFDIAETSAEQKVRIFVLILISGTMSPDKGSRSLLRYLPSLRELDKVSSYNWAGLGYADLLLSLRQGCRQYDSSTEVTVYGLWRVVEIWFYEYFPFLAPRRPHVRAFPIGASWRDRCSPLTSSDDVRTVIRRSCRPKAHLEVVYLPWKGMVEGLEALNLTVQRRVFWGTYSPVWYLGERVVRQHSADHFVVPRDPPTSMMDREALVQYTHGGVLSFAYNGLVHLKRDYGQELIPRLAPAPRLAETAAHHSGVFVPPRRSIRYKGRIGWIEEQIEPAPEGYRQTRESIPPSLTSLPREEVMWLADIIDALKYQLIKWQPQIAYYNSPKDVRPPRDRSRSPPRHGGTVEAQPSHRQSSPEIRRRSHSQLQSQPQPQAQYQLVPPQFWPQYHSHSQFQASSNPMNMSQFPPGLIPTPYSQPNVSLWVSQPVTQVPAPGLQHLGSQQPTQSSVPVITTPSSTGVESGSDASP